MEQCLIFVIHGTGVHSWLNRNVLGRCRWWSPESPFCRGLREVVAGSGEIRPFQWSGDNSHRQRVAAAQQLAQLVEETHATQERRISLIGHSHGGSVALEAANRLPQGRISDIVLLATPIIALRARAAAELPQPGGHVDMSEDGWCWLYWGKAAQRVGGRIWNLYSPQDAVQNLVARYLHGLWDLKWSLRSGMKVNRCYRGSLASAIRNAAIQWETASWLKLLPLPNRGIKPHSAMHCEKMGRLLGHLLGGETSVSEALRKAGLSRSANTIEDLGCPAD